MTIQTITIRGARTHNLKNIDLTLPRDQLIVITGLSGSGKSSLAFDTLYAEGQRRYVESLSAYARQFLSLMEKPEVDHIEGLSPAISIEQKSTSHNPRSTVGTITEIYDYCRLLFARAGTPHCPTHHQALSAQTVSQIVDNILALPNNTRIILLAPIIKDKKGEHLQVLEQLKSQGYVRARIDNVFTELEEAPRLDKRRKHTIEVVIDRLKVDSEIQQRLADSLETALQLSGGTVTVLTVNETQKPLQEIVFSSKFACPECGYSLQELEPRLFSFNNPSGACTECDGLGVKQFIDPNKVIIEPALSILEGAIRNWERHSFYYHTALCALAKRYRFTLNIPFKQLSKTQQDLLLYGDTQQTFEGIIPNMERRYRETESTSVREELAKYLTHKPCISCQGTRLNEIARNVFLAEVTLPTITAFSIKEAFAFFQSLTLSGAKGKIAEKILKEIISRLEFLINVGLEYLSLNRSADTLSGGETQRIRLASQIGAGLVGVMYILDEPSIGLHQRDNARLLKTLTHLRDLGNTVIVVEHDLDTILDANYVVDMGPGAGTHGGTIVASGTPEQIMQNPHSLTGQYLSHQKIIPIPKARRTFDPNKIIELVGASGNNLKNISAQFPIGLLTCITGVSGSGKSTLINDTLYPLAAKVLNDVKSIDISPYKSITGLNLLDKVIDIDQSPIGRTPRSNAATYTGLFTEIRDLFANTAEARSRGYKAGRFSFNVKGGRCEACEGDGLLKVEMHFLPDVYVPCDVCHNKRYNRETLEVLYKGKNIYEVLEMTVEEALSFFSAIPRISKKLETLLDVGLSYIKIGQSATTLSGGEAQRIKLSKELSKRDTGRTLYILDEPTTGLHFEDVNHLLIVLQRLLARGNTVIVIEHNLDVIKTADWIIDLGPEGGDGGGSLVTVGTPEQVARCKASYTGQFLKPLLNSNKPKSLKSTSKSSGQLA